MAIIKREWIFYEKINRKYEIMDFTVSENSKKEGVKLIPV